MKKVLVAILAIFYLSSSMGVTVHLHYCMGRLVSWDLLGQSGANCDFCGMPVSHPSAGCAVGKKPCCHQESVQVRNNNDQKPGQDLFKPMRVIPLVAALPQPTLPDAKVRLPVLSQPVSHGPPLASAAPIFLRNRNFRL